MNAPGANMPAADRGPVTAALAAVSVGLLTAGTLGTVAAVIVGAALHLIGVPDDWATGAAAAVVVASVVPGAGVARRVWLVERHGREF